jgi:rubrerythrin
MKAQHRKELQTNALADRMGRMIQRMKTRPSRGSVLTVFLILLVAGALFFFFWVRGRSAGREADRWVEFLRGSEEDYRELGGSLGHLPVGRAAKAQLAWLHLWPAGIHDLMRAPSQAAKNIERAKELYEELAQDAKDDPVLAPEALYNQAVAEETLAAWSKDLRHDPEKHLDKALELYRDVAEKHKDSAHGKDAEKRAAELADKAGARQQISRFYTQLWLRLQDRHRDEMSREMIEKLLQEQKQKRAPQGGK